MASIWDKEHDLPKRWRGDTFRLLGNLFRVISKAFPDISIWHHAARRALPLSIGQYYPASDFIHPHTFENVIYLSLLEAGIVLAHWQLVRFVPSQTA